MIRKIFLYLMSAIYVGAGINHFWHPDNYLLIIPPYLPWPVFLNAAAGVAEIALGILLLFPASRKLASYGVIVLLILFITVHIYMIQLGGCMGAGMCIPEWVAWVRLFPLQFMLIWWAWWMRK